MSGTQIECPHHGMVDLTNEEEDAQLDKEYEPWRCPICESVALSVEEGDDVEDYDLFDDDDAEDEECLVCGAEDQDCDCFEQCSSCGMDNCDCSCPNPDRYDD